MYRQKKYIMKNYMEVEIFPLPEKVKPYPRAKKIAGTSPAQKRLNDKKAVKYFNRLVHTNFDHNDLFVDLTFNNENLPANRDEAMRTVKNYIARIRRLRKKKDLNELKYIYVISDCDDMGNKKRLHVHMIMNGGLDRDEIEKTWHYGYCQTDRLQPNEYGVTGKVMYMARQSKGDRMWSASKNLEKPVAIVSDKAISRGKAETMERNPEDRAFFEKLYPGWTFTDCTVEYPDDDGLKRGTSFFIRMRKEIKWTPKKKQKSKTISKATQEKTKSSGRSKKTSTT